MLTLRSARPQGRARGDEDGRAAARALADQPGATSARSRLDLADHVDPVDRRDRAAHLDLPRQDEWASRLHKSGIHVVYDHPEMFDDPDNLLNVFEPDKSAPQLVESAACPV